MYSANVQYAGLLGCSACVVCFLYGFMRGYTHHLCESCVSMRAMVYYVQEFCDIFQLEGHRTHIRVGFYSHANILHKSTHIHMCKHIRVNTRTQSHMTTYRGICCTKSFDASLHKNVDPALNASTNTQT